MSRGELQRGKQGSWEVFFLPEMALRSPKTAREPERGNRLYHVACQVADLALEMTEDALREASINLKRCASERALHGSLTVNSASWDHQALREQPRRPNWKLRPNKPRQLQLKKGKRSGQPGGC